MSSIKKRNLINPWIIKTKENNLTTVDIQLSNTVSGETYSLNNLSADDLYSIMRVDMSWISKIADILEDGGAVEEFNILLKLLGPQIE